MSANQLYKLCSAAMTVLLALLITPADSAQNRVDPAKVSVVYRVPGMEKALVRAGVVFDSSTAPPLALDAYIPRGLRKGERRPAIVFVSGAERVREWRWFI